MRTEIVQRDNQAFIRVCALESLKHFPDILLSPLCIRQLYHQASTP